MEFFGMGSIEVLLVLVVAMIFLGPGKIADLARQLGKAVNFFRKATSEFTTNVNSEMDLFKIDTGKPTYTPTGTSQEGSSPPKVDPPSYRPQIPPTTPGSGRPSDNIDSSGAGI